MYKIYKITNLLNNKVYIGQTKNSLSKRFREHCSTKSFCLKLRNAIQKYGKENFTIEKIDEDTTKLGINTKEIHYISIFNSTDDNFGYNIQKGGHEASNLRKKIICLETREVFESASELARLLNVAVDTVARVARGERPRLKGKHFAYLDNDNKPITEIINFNARTNSKRVKCIELDKIYNSAKEASDELGFSRNAVSLCCRGYSETCGGYHWQYIESEVA